MSRGTNMLASFMKDTNTWRINGEGAYRLLCTWRMLNAMLMSEVTMPSLIEDG